MASLYRLVCTWGGSGVTGHSTSQFYTSTAAATLQSAISSFYNGVKTVLPSAVSVSVPGFGDMIESTTGDITGTWTAGTPVTYTGGSSGSSFAAGVGASMTMPTGKRTRNRPCVGRSFIVPLSSVSYDVDGTLNAATMTSLQTSATALWTAAHPGLAVWSRPTGPGAADGKFEDVIACVIDDKVSWLRSRRT